MALFATAFLAVYAALFPIVDPIAGGLIFLGLTGGASPRTRIRMARKVATYAFFVLNIALFTGAYVLAFFGVSLPAMRVAGGLVVAYAGWRMLHTEATPVHASAAPVALSDEDYLGQAFYPITVPLTTGPGTVSVLIALGTGRPEHLTWIENLHLALGAVAATFCMSLTIYAFYALAGLLRRAFGASGTAVAFRITAFILLCIGVQIFWNGAHDMLLSVRNG